MKEDKLVIGGHEFSSRFILGSGKYNLDLIKAAVENAGAEIITLALRRANTQGGENILDYIPKGPPVILTFSIKEQQKFKICEESFKKLGFLIEEFGGNEYCIRGVPANLLGIDPQELFIEIFDQIEENSGKMNLEMITDRLATMACKAAVKGNTAMSYQEMDALMDQLMKLDNPYQCPHGRPTIISMTKYELEKKFKRVQ